MQFRITRLATLALCLSAACSGSISGSPGPGTSQPTPPTGMNPPPTPGGPPGGLMPGETPPPSCMNATVARATALHARLLTPSQYDNTIADLVRVGGDPAAAFGGG